MGNWSHGRTFPPCVLRNQDDLLRIGIPADWRLEPAFHRELVSEGLGKLSRAALTMLRSQGACSG